MKTDYDTDTYPVSSRTVREATMQGGGASSASSAVQLLYATPSFDGATVTVEMEFSHEMAKGAGFIYVTDGAVQTVIDRVTGQPTIRIVGANETRKIAISDAAVVIDVNKVLLHVDGLPQGHTYSVFMGEGALISSSLRPFAGVTRPGTISVTVVDTVAPSIASMELSSGVLAANAPAELTITFSEPVVFTAAALEAQGASIESLHPVGDGRVWVASVSTSATTSSIGNKIALDLAQVRDAAGNPGSGTYLSTAYVIDDGQAPTATIALSNTTLVFGESAAVTVSFSEPVPSLDLAAFSAPHVNLSTPVSGDGGKTWTLTMTPGSTGLHYTDLSLVLDMSKVVDSAGQAGSGSALSPAYAVDSRTGADTEGPTLESISFDGDVLDASHDLVATIRFSEAVQAEGLIDALEAEDASLSGLASSDGGRTWTVTLKLADPDVEPKIGSFGVRLDQVRDLTGNAGSGYDPAIAYAVNTFSSFLFLYDDGHSETDGIVSAESGRFFGGILLGDFPEPETSFELMVDAEQIHNSEIAFHKMDGLLYWYYAGEGSWTEGSHEIVAKAVKADGAVVELSKQIQVDDTAPLIVESPASGTTPPPFDIADNLVIQFSEAVYFTDTEPVLRANISIGGDFYSITVPVYPEYLSGDRKTLTVPADAHQFASGAAVTLTLPTTEDVAGNLLMTDSFSFSTTGTVADTAAPVALGASLGTHDGIPVNVGDTVVFTIRFNEAVTLFGDTERYVNLNNGAKASMMGANENWTELTFHYFVAAEDADIGRLGVQDLGTMVNQIKDAAGNILDTAAVDFGSLYHDVHGYLAVDQTVALLAQPTIALTSDSGDAGDYTTRFNQPIFKGTGAEAGATIVIKVGAATVTDHVVADGAGNWTWTPSAPIVEGAHTLSVQQRDRAGNVSEVRTVDMRIEAFSAPQLDASSDTGVSASDGITTDNTPTYSGSGAIAGSTIKLFAGDTEVGSTTALDDGSWTITSAGLADGSHAIVAREYVGATQTDVSAAASLTVDTAAPTVTAAVVDTGSRAYTLSFNETIVFAPGGGVGMLQDNTLQKEFFASGGNWTKPNDTDLSFEMGSANGLFKMQTSTGALQDIAGNVVIIGTSHLEFTMPALPH